MVRKNPQESFEGERHSEKCQSSFERGGKIGKSKIKGKTCSCFSCHLSPLLFLLFRL